MFGKIIGVVSVLRPCTLRLGIGLGIGDIDGPLHAAHHPDRRHRSVRLEGEHIGAELGDRHVLAEDGRHVLGRSAVLGAGDGHVRTVRRLPRQLYSARREHFIGVRRDVDDLILRRKFQREDVDAAAVRICVRLIGRAIVAAIKEEVDDRVCLGALQTKLLDLPGLQIAVDAGICVVEVDAVEHLLFAVVAQRQEDDGAADLIRYAVGDARPVLRANAFIGDVGDAVLFADGIDGSSRPGAVRRHDGRGAVCIDEGKDIHIAAVAVLFGQAGGIVCVVAAVDKEVDGAACRSVLNAHFLGLARFEEAVDTGVLIVPVDAVEHLLRAVVADGEDRRRFAVCIGRIVGDARPARGCDPLVHHVGDAVLFADGIDGRTRPAGRHGYDGGITLLVGEGDDVHIAAVLLFIGKAGGIVRVVAAIEEEVDDAARRSIFKAHFLGLARFEEPVLTVCLVIPIDAVEHLLRTVVAEREHGDRLAARACIVSKAGPGGRRDVVEGDVCHHARLFGGDDIRAHAVLRPARFVFDGLAVLGHRLVVVELGGKDGHLADAVEGRIFGDVSGSAAGLAALRLALEVEADPELLFKVARKADEGGRRLAGERDDARFLVLFDGHRGSARVRPVGKAIAAVLAEPRLPELRVARGIGIAPEADLELFDAVLERHIAHGNGIRGEADAQHIVDGAVLEEHLFERHGAVEARPVGGMLVGDRRLAVRAAARHGVAAPRLGAPGVVHGRHAVCGRLLGEPAVLHIDIARIERRTRVLDAGIGRKPYIVGDVQRLTAHGRNEEGVRRIDVRRHIEVEIGAEHIEMILLRDGIGDGKMCRDRPVRPARFGAHGDVEILEIGVFPVDLHAEAVVCRILVETELGDGGAAVRDAFLHLPRIVVFGDEPPLQVHVVPVAVIVVDAVEVFARLDRVPAALVAGGKDPEPERARHERAQREHRDMSFLHLFPPQKSITA